MAIELNLTAPTTVTPAAKREEAEVYANIGYSSVDSNGEVTFISTPIGVAIDTQKPARKMGSNENMHQIVDCKNSLLEQLQAIGANLKPGESIVLDQLCIEIRRRKAHERTDDNTNPHMAQLAKLKLIA